MIDPDRERDIVRRRLLGQGLEGRPVPGVDGGRDLALESGPNGLDLARVSGMENLGQALQIALQTLQGSDLFNIEFGFDGLNALVTETDPILQRERVRIAVIQVLRRDPRVRRVVDVKFEDGQLEGPAPGNRELNVKVHFETVTGESGSADLGG